MAANFSGFPDGATTFFQALEANNNREWFEAHKQDYTNDVQKPALAFVEALGTRLQSLSSGIVFDTRANGSGSLMRIYRDIRFSKDKTPYKTNLGIFFWEGERKKMENPGFYFHLDANGAVMHDGLYHFPDWFMQPYRAAVADDELGEELEAAMETVRKAGKYEVWGDQSKRVPAGFDASHPRADLLRNTGMGASSQSLVKVRSAALVDECFEHCRNMLPLHQWLVKVCAEAG